MPASVTLLGPRQPRRHGRLAGDEQAGDLGRRHPPTARRVSATWASLGKRRVAAHEHQPQPLVRHGTRPGHFRLHRFGGLEGLPPAIGHGLAPQPVEPLAPRRHIQPAGRIGRHLERPAFGSGGKGILQALFCQVEITEILGQHGQHPAPVIPVGCRYGGLCAQPCPP